VAWGGQVDRQDTLRLLALIAQSLGVKGLEDYEPPSAELAEVLAPEEEAAGPAEPVERGDMRRKQVAAFVGRFGGEVA
jgi:hypothetical protein